MGPNELFKDVLAVPGALPKVEQAVETNTAEAKSLGGFDGEKESLSKCTSKNDLAGGFKFYFIFTPTWG